MQTLRPSQVPEYLRTSSFYLGLDVTDDDEFSIPSNHTKLNMNVDTFADVTLLLNTIRFWGLEFLPQTMLDFAARQKHEEIESVLEPYRADMQFMTTVCSIVSEVADCGERLEKAMESGNTDVVKYFHEQGVKFTSRAIALAAGKGALNCVQYALNALVANHYSFRNCNAVYSEAVRNGRVDSILFLQQSGFPLQRQHFSSERPGEFMDLPNIAASSGQCDVLRYLHNQGCSLCYADRAAAEAGHWDCLEYAIVNRSFLTSFSTDSLAQQLADAGLYKLFPRALSLSKRIDMQATLKFAETGRWDLFQLCMQYITRPTLDIIFTVTKQGYIEGLQHLHQICVSEIEAYGIRLNWLSYAANNRFSNGNLRPNDLVEAAANGEHWECLEFLITHDCPKSLSAALVQAGKQEAYHSAIALGCEVSVQAACYFVEKGKLTSLATCPGQRMRAVGRDAKNSRAARTAAVPEVRTRTGLSLVGSSHVGGGARWSLGVFAILKRARLSLK